MEHYFQVIGGMLDMLKVLDKSASDTLSHDKRNDIREVKSDIRKAFDLVRSCHSDYERLIR